MLGSVGPSRSGPLVRFMITGQMIFGLQRKLRANSKSQKSAISKRACLRNGGVKCCVVAYCRPIS